MRWFDGDIAQAVTVSKTKNAIFVVFCEGQNDESRKAATLIDSEAVSSKLEGENFVSIRLDISTEAYRQFIDIYRVVSVPCLFMIGRNGVPIAIIDGSNITESSSQLLDQIIAVENTHLGKEAASTVAAQSSSQSTPSVVASSPQVAQEPAAPVNTLGEIQSSELPPIEQRVERAQELLSLKREQKKQDEDEEERRKEMQRRKEGQSMQELKRWQQDQELKQLRDERLRERRLDQEARQRVLEQIAQDRANRNAQSSLTAGASVSADPQTQPTSPPVSSNSNEARLQFRLPDGSTRTNRFEADSTLGDVRNYLITSVSLPFQDFTLAKMFPRQEFTAQDNSTTLRDLQLVPTSVILVFPAHGRAVMRQGSPGVIVFVNQTIWSLVSPVVRVLSYLRSLLFGDGGNNSANRATDSAGSETVPQNTQEKRSIRRTASGSGAYRRTGSNNVHRLHQNHSSSDDDNNTWNGNSTQQM